MSISPDLEETMLVEEEVRAAKVRELELLTKIGDHVQSNAAEYYRPHRKQDAFHRAGQYKRRLFAAGNRAGKSTAGILEDIAWVLGFRPWYPEGDPARYAGIPNRPVKLLVITIDWDKVDEIFTNQRGENTGKLWKYLPAFLPDGRPTVKSQTRNHTGVISFIELNNGSTISFETVRSWLSNPMCVEGGDYDAIHIDEPVPEQMVKGAARGLIDRGGSIWYTLTPLQEAWITDEFAKHSKSSVHWSTRATIYDNLVENGGVLTRADIDIYKGTLSPEEEQCRLLGLPLDKAGMIYKQFDYDRHVLKKIPKGWENYHTPPPEYTVYVYIDPHPQTPHAVLFLAVPPGGFPYFVYDEIFLHTTIPDLATQITARVGVRQLGWVKMDPLGFIENPATDMASMAEVMCQHGIYPEKATKDLMGGILAVQQRLKEEPTSIYFSPHLTETLWEFGHYVWGYVQGRPTNKPVDKDDHMMENLYRAILDCPPYLGGEFEAETITYTDEVDRPMDLSLTY